MYPTFFAQVGLEADPAKNVRRVVIKLSLATFTSLDWLFKLRLTELIKLGNEVSTIQKEERRS